MTRLSDFAHAADLVTALRKLRRLRQAYGNGDSPPRTIDLELDAERITLSPSVRSELNKALAHEEMSITSELRALGVVVDTDLPL